MHENPQNNPLAKTLNKDVKMYRDAPRVALDVQEAGRGREDGWRESEVE